MPTVNADAFGTVTLPDNIQSHVKSLCEELDLTTADLFFKWEAWALAHQKSSDVPTKADLDQLCVAIREKATAAAARAAKAPTPRSKRKAAMASPLYSPDPTPIPMNIDEFFNYMPVGIADSTRVKDEPMKDEPMLAGDNDNGNDGPGTPVKDDMKLKAPLAQPQFDSPGPARGAPEDDVRLPADDVPDVAYAKRAGSGRVEATHAAASGSGERRRARATTRVVGGLSGEVRYMNDNLASRMDALRARVTTLGAALLRRVAQAKDMENVPQCAADAFFVASPSLMYVVGRIRVELDETEGVGAGRINANSVLLESVDGNLVKLDLKRLYEEKRPLFLSPGMVVVVEGVNTNGRQIDVHAVYDNCTEAPSEISRPSQVKKEEDSESANEPSVNIIAAAGPLTTSSNLKYEPLDDLLQVIKRNKPDMVFLAGPFVDMRHAVLSDTVSVPFETIFEARVLARIVACAQQMRIEGDSCEFFLIPSLDDVHHEFVCPQPAFRWPDDVDRDERVHLVTNPCVIEVLADDGAYCSSIGTSSLPTVMDISSDSICANSDRFQAIASHIVKQRSFYPTFPPSANVPLDSTLMDALVLPASDTTSSVDLLVVPSRMKAFAKSAEAGTMVVNPGLLCRGAGGGTYAEISLALHRSDVLRSMHFNEARTEVNVVRL